MGFRDKSNVGRSTIVPYIHGESSEDRHWRRIGVNLRFKEAAQQLAQSRGLSLRIANDGHHWMLTRSGFVADWWPSSAKLVFNRQWRKGIHVHDYEQLFQEIDKYDAQR